MSDPAIPGLMRTRINLGTPKRPRQEFFYLINLAEITQAVVEGTPSLGPNDGSDAKDFWTDFELAKLIINLSPSAVAKLSEDDKLRLARNTLDIISGNELNDQAWTYARSNGGWHSVLVDPEGSVEIGPTILYVRESEVRHRTLRKRYRDLCAQRTYRAFYADAHYFGRLATFEDDYLEPVRSWQAELDESMSIVRHASSRVSNAHLAVVAMFDCASSGENRRKLWNSSAPREPRPDVFETLVPRRPSTTERKNAASVRDSYLPSLFKSLSELLVWMSSGQSKGGKSFAEATLRNSSAQRLLDALRSDKDILKLLESHMYVDRVLWRRLENLLLESFHFLLLAPNTRDALLAGELAHLARHVSTPVPALDVLVETTRRSRDIKAAMERFVPGIEFSGESTRLSEAFLELKSNLDPALDHRSTITKLWSLATPTLMDHIEQAARKRGDINPSAFAASWGWRSTFGIVELDEETQKELWEAAVTFTADPTKKGAKGMFAAKGLRVESRFWNSKAAWSAYEATIAIIAATDAMKEHADEPTPDTALKAWIAAIGAAKGLPELAKTLTETETFIRMASGRGKSLFSSFAEVTDTMPFKLLDGVVAVLQMEVSRRAMHEALESKTASEGDKDIARENYGLSVVGAAVTGVGMVVGSPLVIAGSMLFIGSQVLLNRSVWDACLSGVEGLPGPGRVVKLAWTEMVEGAEGKRALVNLVKGTPWEVAIATSVEQLRSVTSDTSQVGRGAFWPLCSGDIVMAPLLAGTLRRQYGFNLELAKELAAY